MSLYFKNIFNFKRISFLIYDINRLPSNNLYDNFILKIQIIILKLFFQQLDLLKNKNLIYKYIMLKLKLLDEKFKNFMLFDHKA
jgi:hypothetical protein